jgi:hypothetical protein
MINTKVNNLVIQYPYHTVLVLDLASVAQVLSQKGEGDNKGFLNPDKLFFKECPARPRENRATQLDPTSRKVAPCLTKSWLRALALDSRTGTTPKN